MKTIQILSLPALCALLVLGGCDKPKWQDKSAGAPTAAAPATGAPKVRVVPVDPAATPAAPAWAAAVIGKSLRDAYPNTGICKGNTDIVQKTYAGAPAGVQIHGWGWDTGRKARVEHVLLVDKSFRIVGAGQGGVPRPDVPPVVPEITDEATGWNADVAVTAGPLDAYGVTAEDGVCQLGHIEF